jgi:hypothetical protein
MTEILRCAQDDVFEYFELGQLRSLVATLFHAAGLLGAEQYLGGFFAGSRGAVVENLTHALGRGFQFLAALARGGKIVN